MSFEMHSFCSFQLLHFITDKFPLSWSLLHLLLRLVFQLCQIFLSRSCCWNLQLLVGNIDVKNATNSVNMITDGSQCPECVFLEVITFNLFIDWKLSLNCCLSMWQQHDNLNYSPQLCNRWAVWQSVMKEFVNLTWRRIEDPWHTALNELTETCDTLPWMNSLRPVTHCLEWTHCTAVWYHLHHWHWHGWVQRMCEQWTSTVFSCDSVFQQSFPLDQKQVK